MSLEETKKDDDLEITVDNVSIILDRGAYDKLERQKLDYFNNGLTITSQ